MLIKNTIVSEDPKEKGLRKTLNFGHTLGHAIESYFLESDSKVALLHGEAIAIGMILEGYLSYKLTGLTKNQLDEIATGILKTFSKIEFKDKDYSIIIELMKHDKKNSHGIIKFVLLESIGKAKIDIEVPNDLILEAFSYYKSL